MNFHVANHSPMVVDIVVCVVIVTWVVVVLHLCFLFLGICFFKQFFEQRRRRRFGFFVVIVLKVCRFRFVLTVRFVFRIPNNSRKLLT